MTAKALRSTALLCVTALLTGCQKLTVLFPAGYVAEQQSELLVASVVMMLLIIIPIFIAIPIIAFRYRNTNKKASYAPEWEHSTKLELLIWAAPLAIVVALGAMTWVSTHLLDPFSDLTHINENTLVTEEHDPIKVNAIAMQWKWLFLYPEYGIATVGEMAVPINTPIDFGISASDTMNSFFIPALAGQIYAMPGMATELAAAIDEPGTYKGISANFNGHGFNHMDFDFVAMRKDKFKQWVAKVRKSNLHLTEDQYRKLAVPSVEHKVIKYSEYADELFRSIVLRCFAGREGCNTVGDTKGDKTTQHETTSRAENTATEVTSSH